MAANRAKPPELVAVATLPATQRDGFGDTLGSFSALAVVPESLQSTRSSVSFDIWTLPDRGYNIPDKHVFSDYSGRLHRLTLSISASGTSELTYRQSVGLRDPDGALTTGLDPGSFTKLAFGGRVPAHPRAWESGGRLTLDCEGLARRSDGHFYISDEYSCAIYHCDPDGHMRGVIRPPLAIAPRKAGKPHFSSNDADPPEWGRQPNDGLEGLCLTPDEKTLMALMQSPLVQDLSDDPLHNRYVRLLTYDVSKDPCPAEPNGHYLIALPTYGSKREDRHDQVAEANDLLALDAHNVWILARDGRGYGARKRKAKARDQSARPIRLKGIFKTHLDPRANLAETAYAQTPKSVLKNGTLRKGLHALEVASVIDLCDEDSLNRFGLTCRPDVPGLHQLSAKWESLALTPPIGPKGQSRYLLVGNDNDFGTRRGFMPGGTYDAELDHPNMILIYRVHQV